MNRPGKRLLAMGLALLFGFSLLILQFYKIQIVEGEGWAKKAEQQHHFYVKEPFRRGRFFSNAQVRRNHNDKAQQLVVDIEKFHLYVDPLSIPPAHSGAVAAALSELLALEEGERVPLRSQFDKQSRSRQLAMWLESEECDRIAAWWYPYAAEHKIPKNGLYFVPDYQRSYPFGKLLGQLLHTVQNTKEAATGQAIPTGGLEYTFNALLKGSAGKRRLMRSPRHAFETGEVIASPENGADIYLTINHCLQAICEQEVEKGVHYCKAKAGWAVMMNPKSGELFAVAQYPFFDPRDYRRYYSDPALIEETRLKAATDAQEPGSVVKAITAAIALLANEELGRRGEPPLFDPEEKMASANGKFPGRSQPLKDTRLHKFLNMDMAVQKSSNIYVARLTERIVNRLGAKWYRDTLQERFGFGIKTGVEVPSEHSGLLPLPGKRYPSGKLEWSVPTPFSLAMGYNLQANSFQVLRAFAVFANGGFLVQPTLIRKVVKSDSQGEEKTLLLPGRKKARRVLPQKVVERILRSLKYVTKPGGGGARADIWGYTEAGKTGTVRKLVDGAYSTENYCCSFVGFPLVESPPFILIVVMDEPDTGYREGVGHTYYGSIAAAPVFKEICRRSLDYLGIAPDDPCGYPPNDPRSDPKRADWVEETRLLKEKYETWNK